MNEEYIELIVLEIKNKLDLILKEFGPFLNTIRNDMEKFEHKQQFLEQKIRKHTRKELENNRLTKEQIEGIIVSTITKIANRNRT